jgi:hypothetical protein
MEVPGGESAHDIDHDTNDMHEPQPTAPSDEKVDQTCPICEMSLSGMNDMVRFH